MDLKFYVYQVIAIGIIWTGMAIFFNQMDELSKLIFYGVTSWLLLLIVLLVKKIARQRKEKEK